MTTNNLCRFLENTDTPITIALQGEWGSGKTSLMNALRSELCDNEGKRFFPVWINTWHHSLMANAEMSVISILQAMIWRLSNFDSGCQILIGRVAETGEKVA